MNHPSQQTASIDLSIVLEWENVLLAEADRCSRMLRQLGKQVTETSLKVEVIVLYNPDQVDGGVIERTVHDHLESDGALSQGQVRIEQAPGLHYYELKNEGAMRARGSVVVFIDSDIIPEDGWLGEISQPLFDRPEVAVVAGNTYLAFDSVFEKAFALAWFFPLRNDRKEIHAEHAHFYANSVAFRRDIFLKYKFPKMQEGVTRGACVDLAHTLIASGVPIWTNTGAQASHPPPADIHHYVTRGLAQGRDNLSRDVGSGNSRVEALAKSLRWSAAEVKKAVVRMAHERHRVKLALWQTPGALAIISVYYTLAFVGGGITAIAPGYATRRWQI